MRELGILQDLVVVLGVAIPTVAIAHRLRIPAIVGFFLVGAVIGPYGLALIPDAESVTVLADLGVLLLLFTIGLELSLTRVMQLGRVALQGGALQVGGTLVAVRQRLPQGSVCRSIRRCSMVAWRRCPRRPWC